MAAKSKSKKVKSLPAKTLTSRKAQNVKGGEDFTKIGGIDGEHAEPKRAGWIGIYK